MKKIALPKLIGVVHLPPLAGAPGARELTPASALQRAGVLAVREAGILAAAGFEGLVLENFGDIPFHKTQVPPETIASMAVIAAAVREATKIPIGINVLRNDARSALAIAAVAGCEFIRVNVLSGVVASDQGWLEGCAAELLRERDHLGAEVAILGDALVKHGRTISADDVELAVEELALRAFADGVVVTGATTGRPVELDRLKRAARSARHCGVPLWIGSGAKPEELAALLGEADGVIVGSAIRRGSKAGQPLEPKRAREFAKAFREARKKKGKSRRL